MFSLIIREAWEELQQKQSKESKEFMKPVITPSGEDYLETILVLQKKLGMVRSVDVARHMEVSKPSVCHTVAPLRNGDLPFSLDFSIKDRPCSWLRRSLIFRIA